MIEKDPQGRPVLYEGVRRSPDCAQCPCAVNGQPRKAVPGRGARGGLLVLGEGPGTEELIQDHAFVGPSGRLLNRVFRGGDIDRGMTYITNSLLCARPPGDANLEQAVAACRPRLEVEIQTMRPAAILALGGTALRALRLRSTTVTDARGTVQESPLCPGVPVIGSIHPAALLRGGSGEGVAGGKQKLNVDAQFVFLQADTTKSYRMATGVIPAHWSDDIFVITEPAHMEHALRTAFDDAYRWGLLGLDFEWDDDGRFTWMGLGTARRAFSFWVPVFPAGLVPILKQVMADAALPKIIQNLQADKGEYERVYRSPMGGRLEDTMLLHHAAWPGVSHELQQIVSQYLVVPPWKVMQRDRETEMKETAKDAKKAAKAEAKRLAHEARNRQRAADKEARKLEKQRQHEERNRQRAETKSSRKKTSPAPAASPPPTVPAHVEPGAPVGAQNPGYATPQPFSAPPAPPPPPAPPGPGLNNWHASGGAGTTFHPHPQSGETWHPPSAPPLGVPLMAPTPPPSPQPAAPPASPPRPPPPLGKMVSINNANANGGKRRLAIQLAGMDGKTEPFDPDDDLGGPRGA